MHAWQSMGGAQWTRRRVSLARVAADYMAADYMGADYMAADYMAVGCMAAGCMAGGWNSFTHGPSRLQARLAWASPCFEARKRALAASVFMEAPQRILSANARAEAAAEACLSRPACTQALRMDACRSPCRSHAIFLARWAWRPVRWTFAGSRMRHTASRSNAMHSRCSLQ